MSQVMTKAEALRCHELHGRREEILDSQHPVTPQELRELAAIDEELKTFANKTFPMPKRGQPGQWGPPAHLASPRTTSTFQTSDGSPIHMLSPGQRLTDLPAADGGAFKPLSLGKLIVGLTTGQWRGADAERLAMAESWNSGGGYLVSDDFSRQVVDYARAKSAVLQSGAQTVTWADSDRLVMARVLADPTFEVRPENSAFTERNLTFEQIAFTAQKIGCVITMSRELASDAPNAGQIIEQTLGRALAVELDRLALVGSGSAEPNGLLNYTGIGSTGAIGAIAWEDVHAAAVAVRNSNFEPSAYVCSPTIGGNLDIIVGGDAVNASKNWLGAPPSLAGVARFTTSNCPDANLFIGDWREFVFAVRQGVEIEVSTQAGNAFVQHQLLTKVTWRGNFGCLHASAFHVLSGITT